MKSLVFLSLATGHSWIYREPSLGAIPHRSRQATRARYLSQARRRPAARGLCTGGVGCAQEVWAVQSLGRGFCLLDLLD